MRMFDDQACMANKGTPPRHPALRSAWTVTVCVLFNPCIPIRGVQALTWYLLCCIENFQGYPTQFSSSNLDSWVEIYTAYNFSECSHKLAQTRRPTFLDEQACFGAFGDSQPIPRTHSRCSPVVTKLAPSPPPPPENSSCRVLTL